MEKILEKLKIVGENKKSVKIIIGEVRKSLKGEKTLYTEEQIISYSESIIEEERERIRRLIIKLEKLEY